MSHPVGIKVRCFWKPSISTAVILNDGDEVLVLDQRAGETVYGTMAVDLRLVKDVLNVLTPGADPLKKAVGHETAGLLWDVSHHMRHEGYEVPLGENFYQVILETASQAHLL